MRNARFGAGALILMTCLVAFGCSCSASHRDDRTAMPSPAQTPVLASFASDATPVATFTPAPPRITVRDYADALNDALYYLAMTSLPGEVVGQIDSVSYVKTTFGAASDLLGLAVSPPQSAIESVPAGDTAWLFVEYDNPYGVSAVLGTTGGWAGTLWVLVPEGFTPISSGFDGFIDLSQLGDPIVIAPGEIPELDALRVPSNLVVDTSADAVLAVARSFTRTLASVSTIAWVQTSAWRVGSLFSVAGLPPNTPVWMFEARGDFELRCSFAGAETTPSVRLVVVAGRSSPYLTEPAPERPPLSDFGTATTMVPGQWPAIDQFRQSQGKIEATATARATAHTCS